MVSGLLNDNELETALTRYQMFTGLPVTGRLDDKTMAQMKQPRCGIKDPIIKIKSRTINKKRYLHQGSYWRKEVFWVVLTYLSLHLCNLQNMDVGIISLSDANLKGHITTMIKYTMSVIHLGCANTGRNLF